MLNFLHIALYDKKFFSNVKKQFDSDNRFYNQYIAFGNKAEKINFEESDNCEFLTTYNQLKNVIHKYEYDYVFFHSLTPEFAKLILKIPPEKKIIWWAWGFDLYSVEHTLPPFIPIEIFKPLTKKQFDIRKSPILVATKSLFLRLYHSCNKNKIKKIIRRINYFQPVTQIEYLLLKTLYPFLDAKEFYYPNSFGNNLPIHINKPCNGNSILLGNSATYTNNHLDVWKDIKEFVNIDQKIFIPVSYGNNTYANKLKEKINTQNTVFLDKFLTREQYKKLIDECAYFIIGSMRQQAMGNVSICIEKGIKIFAYKNSIIYMALKSYGCYVFAIEEIDSTSFSTPLTIEQANHNIECYRTEKSRRDLLLEEFFNNEMN